MTLKQYATIFEFKLEHFHCGVEQEDICWFCQSEVYLKLKFHLFTLILKIIVHHVETVGLRSRGLWVTGAWPTEKTDNVPGCVWPVPLLICTRVLLLRRGEGQLWLLYVVCCGRGWVLWGLGARTWILRSGDDLWISHLWARHVRLRLPWASVRQRWENLSQYLSTESWEQTGEEERQTCCHFHPERPLWDRWGEKIFLDVHNTWLDS